MAKKKRGKKKHLCIDMHNISHFVCYEQTNEHSNNGMCEAYYN